MLEDKMRSKSHDDKVLSEDSSTLISTAYHAPTLTMTKDDKLSSSICIGRPMSNYDATDIIYVNTDIKINNKKKAIKKAIQTRKERFVDSISCHLASHGWVCIENLLPLDVIRRVRIEANLFADHYEQSEIWVGKEADIGAHLQVPSVRGGTYKSHKIYFFFLIHSLD